MPRGKMTLKRGDRGESEKEKGERVVSRGHTKKRMMLKRREICFRIVLEA